jgi:hypothetical protein
MEYNIFSDKSYQVLIFAFSKEQKEVEDSSVFRVDKDTVQQKGKTFVLGYSKKKWLKILQIRTTHQSIC